ncbi:MAG: thioredoxin domain-containing protein [Bacteriovoracaceae bacterium]|jgi:protein-disulfide isomerase|nr:thioredoxin domain-containing protein [Bacteriovoracaceae bacterium]
MKLIKLTTISIALMGLASCMSDSQLKDKMTKLMKENPKILVEAIEANPADFVEAIQKAAKNAQEDLKKKRALEEKKKLAETFDKPLVPNIRADEAIRGNKNAPLTLVEYSDFECPFCKRGFDTVQALRAKYGNKIRFVYKHLPLSFHKQAKVGAQYFEAIRLQSAEKAFKFHDAIFDDQRAIKNGTPFFKRLAKSVGADMKKLASDLNSKTVNNRIEEDLKEAAGFGMQGTPGFLINGVPVKGAYPPDHFVGIVDELIKRGKVKL